MRHNVELGEIVFCDMIIKHKGKTHLLENIVYKNVGDKLFYYRSYLEKLKINVPVEIEEIKIISRLGFENKSKEFTEVKKNDEQRNQITGTYE